MRSEYVEIEEYESETTGFQGIKKTFPDGTIVAYHGTLWPILETCRHKLKDKHHNVITISGRVGTGKSEFSFQIAKYLDPKFTLDNVYWNTDDLIAAAASSDNIKPRGTVFIFDEAREGTQSINAMSETNRKMGLFLDTIRSRGYHIILTQPSPWSFQKGIFVYASDLHFHIEKKGNQKFIEAIARVGPDGDLDGIREKPFERGYVRVYDADQKLKLYIDGKKLENLNVASSTMFTFEKSQGLIDWDEYDRRKNLAVAAMNNKFNEEAKPLVGGKSEKIMKFKQKVYWTLVHECGWNQSKVAKYFNEEQGNVSSYISSYANIT